MAFEHRITARFHEADPVGVVFFGRYFEYAHVAFEELLQAAFGAGPTPFEKHGFGLPLVHAQAGFRRPTRRGDRLIVSTTIERWSERSVTFAHTVRGADDPQDIRAIVRLKHAYVRFPDFTPIPRPEAFTEVMDAMGVTPDESDP